MKFRLIIDQTQEEEIAATVHRPSPLTHRIEELVMQYAGIDRITAYRDDEMKTLLFSQIECVTIEDGKTYAIDTRGQRYLLKQRLYELEAVLPAAFIRINKSALANEARLERFTVAYNGAVDAVFRCGYREYVSRRCFAVIKRRFDAQ